MGINDETLGVGGQTLRKDTMDRYTFFYHQRGIRATQSSSFVANNRDEALRAFCFQCIIDDNTGIFFELENADLNLLHNDSNFYTVENKFGAFGIVLDYYTVDFNAVDIKSAVAEYTGGNIYVYAGQFADGTWFMAGDLCGNAIKIVNADPIKEWDDAWYLEWQEEHLVREVVDGALLHNILVAVVQAMENGVRMGACLSDIKDRIQILDEDGEI